MAKAPKFFHGFINPFKSPLGRGPQQQEEEDLETIAASEQKQFRLESLVAATQNFHQKHKLGEGGFGPVFKGKLEDGRAIAVKKLSRSLIIGKKEFKEEARLLARVQHKNVANLLGCCADGAEKLLVYEYVANESLDKHLFKSYDGKKGVLDWKKRYDVIVGVARGLLYLHEGSPSCIIHRDISASNILLDDKWTPKITDFGMVRLFPEDQTGVNTRVAGTNGYMAPEFAMHGQLTVKADVFSYGVLVLELITGRKNSTFNGDAEAQNLLEWAWKIYKKGRALDITDAALASTGYDAEQVSFCIQMGLLCTQADPKPRPTMRQVMFMLSKKPATLEEPMRPGHPGSRYRRRRKHEGSSAAGGSSSSGVRDPSTSSSSSSSRGKQPMEN